MLCVTNGMFLIYDYFLAFICKTSLIKFWYKTEN